MRISHKRLADIASEMVKNQKNALDKREETLKKEIVEVYRKSIPKTVMVLTSKYKKYFSFQTVIRVRFGNKQISLYFEYDNVKPVIANYYGDAVLRLPEKCAFAKEYDAIQQERKDTRELRRQIENTLIKLSTDKAIIAQFPEAAKYLKTKFAVVSKPVDPTELAALRKKLK